MKTLTLSVIPCHDTESIAKLFRSTTPPSFRATTRNPALKLFSRLFAVFGLVMMFAVSGWASTLSYNNTSGSGNIASVSRTTGTTIQLSDGTGMTRNGYALTSWNTSSNGTGTSYALGANYTFTSSNVTLYAQWSVSGPDMSITGNGVMISDNDNSPSSSDNTDFGSTAIGTPVTKIFTITNTGTATLSLSGNPIVATTGDFTVTSQPSVTSLTAGASTIFTVSFNPTATGTRSGTISTANNVTAKNPYNFSITGTGVAPEVPPTLIANVPDQFLTVGTAMTALDFDNYFTATNGDTITYTLTGTLPAGLSYSTSTHAISGTPTAVTATRTFTIKATDNDGFTSDSFTITVMQNINFTNANPRNFTKVNTFNDNGDISIVGNSIEIDASGGCPDPATSNNGINTMFADVDSDPSTFNSTTADLVLPAGVSTANDILWAGLYWQGYYEGTTNLIKSNAQTALLKTPAMTNYTPIVSDNTKFNWVYFDNTKTRWYYQGMQDVTNYVKQSLGGTYTVANIYSQIGQPNGGAFGAWSLVVFYHDSSATLKNLTAFDGYIGISSSDTGRTGVDANTTVPLSGFLTPSSGSINSKFLLFAGEGDIGIVGDSASLSNTVGDTSLTNTLNPNSNIFNASETVGTTGSSANYVTTRNPSCQNTIGVDIDTFNVGTTGQNIIKTNQTSTNVKLISSGDGFFPGVFAFSTDIYQPFISIRKTTNSSGSLTPNQAITYSADINNSGNEGASNIVIFDNFDDNNLSTTAGNITNPLVTLGSLLDHNTTKMWNSIVCKYGPSNSDCKNTCTVTDNPFKLSCPIPLLAVGQTASIQFTATLAAHPDTKGQSVEVENKMFASYYNALTGASVGQSSSNPANAGQYLYSLAPLGGVDVIDPDQLASYSSGSVIKTKVANKDNIQLTAVYLGSGTTPTNYTGSKSMPIMMKLSDGTCSTEENLATSGFVSVEMPVGGSSVTSSAFTMTPVARRDARIRLYFIDWSNLPGGDYSQCLNVSNTSAVLDGVPSCINSDQHLQDAFGASIYTTCGTTGAHPACQSASYNSGNLPDSPYDNPQGCFICLANALNGAKCSVDHFAIRPDRFEFTAAGLMKAGEDYNITTYAKNYSSIVNTTDYNQTVSNLTGVPKSWWNRDTNAQIATVNTQGTTTIAGAWNFGNGTGSVPIRFSDVGKFTLDLNDTNWAAVDTDTALVDRTIHGEGNVTFIPWDFNISTASITNNKGISPSFTYLSSDLNMSARIPMTVWAQNKQGSVTQNYANNMFDRNITIRPYVSSVAATARGLTPLTLGVANADGNFTTGSTSIAYNDALVGRFNFSRDPKVAVSPFDVNSSNGVGSDVNISIIDTDSVYGDKNQTLDGNATFVYGRIIPRDVRVFGAVPFTANAWYEVYNAPNIAGIALGSSKNEAMWYINTLHSDVTGSYDGDANVTYIGSTLQAPVLGGPVGSDGMEDYNFNAIATIPFGAKAHIDTDSWLWYGVAALPYADPSAGNLDCQTHPCFNINIVPPIGATGSAKTETENSKSNKTSTSGGGGWHSTTDYAPAIR